VCSGDVVANRLTAVRYNIGEIDGEKEREREGHRQTEAAGVEQREVGLL
jgi:hypothetical protein